jgi:RecA-family ATPase
MENSAKIVAVSDIKPERVKWLWKNFIPMSRLSECIGDGGIGKSTMSLALIADITAGRPLPGFGSDLTEPASVLYLNAEDNYADTVRPRLE